MSTIRTTSMSGGSRFVAVRMMSGIAKASSRGRTDTSIRRSWRYLGVTRRSHPILEVSRYLGQVEVHPCGQGLHAAARHQRAEVSEDNTGEDMQPGVGSHQRCAPGVVQRATNRSSRGRHRIVLCRDQVVVVQLAGSHDARAHATPEQHAFVRRLPTAAWIERGPVQDDPAVLVRGKNDRVPFPDRRVVEVEPMGVRRATSHTGTTVSLARYLMSEASR